MIVENEELWLVGGIYPYGACRNLMQDIIWSDRTEYLSGRRNKMSSKIKFGVIGAGWMGAELLDKVVQNPDADLVSVFDPNKENTKGLKERFNLTDSVFVNSEEEVLDSSIDAVIIASPNDLHGYQSIMALKKGKHVFCEKPAATKYKEILIQKRLDESNPGLITFVDYILQFDDMEKKLHQMIEQKIFGEISHIQINYRHAINIAGNKIWKTGVEAIGMGPIHSVHLVLWHMIDRKLESVYVSSMAPQGKLYKVPPIYNVHMQFDNGASGIIPSNIETPNGYDVYHNIFGTDGWFIFDPQAYVSPEDPKVNFKIRYKSRKTTDDKWTYPLHKDLCNLSDSWPEGMSFPDSGDIINTKTKEGIEHFIECIKNGTKSPLGFSDSFHTAETVFAILLSAACKTPVSLPLDEKLVFEHLG